jgi:hypothetical protein
MRIFAYIKKNNDMREMTKLIQIDVEQKQTALMQ